MKYTNKLNLPAVFNKIIKDKEPVKNRYSVTELLKSTKEIRLSRYYWNDLETDISDGITALFGSAVHKVFEENSDENAEVKLELQIGEDTLVGIIDHINGDEIEDYKTTSVSKVMKKDFKEHELQIKIYAWMRFQLNGDITRKGKLYYLMKDWSKVKAASGGNYPQCAIYIHSFDIQDSDYDYVEEYVINKLKDIRDNTVYWSCSDEDRWYTGTKYAVYKNVNDKKATYVTDSEEDAHNYIRNKCDGAAEIQVRKGEYLKCKYYCNCNKFCDQWGKEEK